MRVLLGVAWLAFVFGLLEVGSGWWISRYGDALDRTRAVVRADATLGWRQKAGLDTMFYGQPLRTDANGWRGAGAAGEGDILLLGPSSAFGWGVAEEETYAALLAKSLGRKVLNAAEIGFSSDQGLRLFRAHPELRPKLVLVAYGVNDVDRNRFYFQSAEPDAVELAREHGGAPLHVFQALSRSSLLSLLYKVANLGRSGFPQTPTVRVSPDEYDRNLRELAAEAGKRGAKLVFLGTPTGITVPPGGGAAAELGVIRHLLEVGDSVTSRRRLEELFRKDPSVNEAYYYLSALARQEGKADEARLLGELARATEPARIHRDVIAYNAVMRKTAAGVGAPFVDLYALLPASKAELYFDPIHPSAKGHALIAEAVGKAISSPPRR